MQEDTPKPDYSIASSIQKAPSFFAKNRTWLNILLFVTTVISTFVVGISWSTSYLYAEALSKGDQIALSIDILRDPQVISLSVFYAVALISILFAHEMGHYLSCRYYRVDATLPFFIPAPFPLTLIGTFGAFIKIRSPITRKHQLFDIGIAGPLAGFALALPAAVYGLAHSAVYELPPQEGSIFFGEPLLFKGIALLFLQDVPAGADVIVHPVAFAGWVGILLTALNLSPIGQLDGGHIIYAMFGSKSRKLANWIFLAFIIMGIFFWVGWFVFALLIKFLGLKHPPILDEKASLSGKRKALGYLVVVIFFLSFIPDPIQGYSLLTLLGWG